MFKCPDIFTPMDPDPGSQNVADPTDPDPKPCLKSSPNCLV